ncbi:uncharacterized protein DUF4279 [Actinocorallia herbida]|uniref:Uncharacterized protein DUF4279 n=1 Tax=Actinocorallia herbida TaxID=58109 RepID=A0A3N1D0H8_9ACTN|nr:DUF4279 domain-containing protein [Actinocorallia herbida]ROO86548.1 uncharacterized protein DUF4279 [Actinocorallia herbida]
MPTSQYVHFALFSERTSAAAVTAHLGVEPDEATVRDSRPAVPVTHRWEISCREPGLCVDEQISCVLTGLRPHLDGLADLARRLRGESPGGGAVLEIVRCFTDERPPSGEADGPDLFGRHLDTDVLDFLIETGASSDVDEYDLTGD